MSGYDFENFTFKFIEDVENNILEYQTELSAGSPPPIFYVGGVLSY